MNSARENTYGVIVVGGGPVGLTLANLLGLHGVRTLILEQNNELSDSPRAVSLDDESLRIWQQCGLIDRILPFVAQGAEGDVVFTYRSSSGKPLFNLTQQGRPYGYARGNVFLYHRVLAELLAGVERFDRINYQPGHKVTGFKIYSDRIVVSSRDLCGTESLYSGAYLVGCDGGRSMVRAALELPLQGVAYEESWLIVDTFSAAGAGQQLREGVEVWCDARCPTATIPLPGGYRRWEFLLRKRFCPQPEKALDTARIEALISRRKPLGDARVVRKLVHTYKARIVKSYSSGRVFLAGDAAHLSPPFAGQGMATGLRDAANLAWKLAHVLRDVAPPELLLSYEAERRPHQIKMLKLARRMGQMMMPKNSLHAGLIQLFFSVAGRFGPLRRMMEIRGQNITPVYRIKPAHRGSRIGQYLPQPVIGDHGLLDDRLGQNFTLITFDGTVEDPLSDSEKQYWRKCGIDRLRLLPDGETSSAYRVFDDWLGGCRNRMLIVRPDRFVCEDRLLVNGTP